MLELGKRAIDTGECDQAIVGCATLSFHPEIAHHFKDRGYLCDDGTTKPFDEDGKRREMEMASPVLEPTTSG